MLCISAGPRKFRKNVLLPFSQSKDKPSKGTAISNFCLTQNYITPRIKNFVEIEYSKIVRILKIRLLCSSVIIRQRKGDLEIKIGCLHFYVELYDYNY
jgi:hypothetical protein